MNVPTLYIFSGLPACGKSTLAKKLTREIKATYIRIDTIEQGLRDICNITTIEGEGYRLSYHLAKDNLALGNDVIADSVNPWKLTRDEWNQVAKSVGAHYINIEIICADQKEHKKRVETRAVGINNLKLPTWKAVTARDYHEWDTPRIQIDTSGKSITESSLELMLAIKEFAY